jgi:hypothetical protein
MQQFNENEQKHYKTHAHKAKFATPEQEYEEYSSKTEKKCTKCAIVKTLDKFNGNTSGADPFDKKGYRLRRPECSECTKLAGKGKDVAKKIAKEQQIAYKAPEGTLCGICEKPGSAENVLVFDHCHTTERFRGYLCNSCNRSAGVLGDNVEGLLRVLNYLNASEKRTIIQDADGNLRFGV